MSDKNKKCKLYCNKWINNIKNKNFREIYDIGLIEKIKIFFPDFSASDLACICCLTKVYRSQKTIISQEFSTDASNDLVIF